MKKINFCDVYEYGQGDDTRWQHYFRYDILEKYDKNLFNDVKMLEGMGMSSMVNIVRVTL